MRMGDWGLASSAPSRSSRAGWPGVGKFGRALYGRPADKVVSQGVRDNRWDLVGIFVSGLCLIHCLLLPFILAALPSMALRHTPEIFHFGVAVVAVPAGVFAFLPGFLRHRKLWVPLVGMLGLVLLVTASVYHEEFNANLDRVITTMGGVMLVTAHLKNRRLCQSECC